MVGRCPVVPGVGRLDQVRQDEAVVAEEVALDTEVPAPEGGILDAGRQVHAKVERDADRVPSFGLPRVGVLDIAVGVAGGRVLASSREFGGEAAAHRRADKRGGGAVGRVVGEDPGAGARVVDRLDRLEPGLAFGAGAVRRQENPHVRDTRCERRLGEGGGVLRVGEVLSGGGQGTGFRDPEGVGHLAAAERLHVGEAGRREDGVVDAGGSEKGD